MAVVSYLCRTMSVWKYQVVFSQLLLLLSSPSLGDQYDEEEYGVKYATDCEVCKVVTLELERTLQKTAGKHEVRKGGQAS
jgi:hypothetical protein